MADFDSLRALSDKWQVRVTEHLTKRDGIRAGLADHLVGFFDQMVTAIESGNSSWIDATVTRWAFSASEAQPTEGSLSMVPMISEIMDETFRLFAAEFSDEYAVNLTLKSLPVFKHAIEIAANQELEARLKKSQNELLKAQNILEKVEKTKSDFISVAAHELKTPLTLIEGYTSMLHDAMNSTETRRLQSALCIKGINAGTKRLREIVDDMIDASMIDSNLLVLNYQPTWINRICTAIQRELSSVIQQRQQTLTIKEFPGSNEMIFADGERIYQAMRNLISNAVKYTPDGGVIIVDGRMLPGFIEIIVTDSGIGIDPEDQQRIFEKFGRLGNASLHSSSKTKFKGGGPGLGLPITKGIIEAHGGAIWVESEGYDEIRCPGSVFHVVLPNRKTPPAQTSAHPVTSLVETE
jgi:signal transduction histidine kinase